MKKAEQKRLNEKLRKIASDAERRAAEDKAATERLNLQTKIEEGKLAERLLNRTKATS